METFFVIVLVLLFVAAFYGNGVLVIALFSGDISFISYDNNGISVFIAAIADCILLYFLIKKLLNHYKTQRIATVTGKVNDILKSYTPANVISLQKSATLQVDASQLNKELIFVVQEYKKSIFALLSRCSETDKKINDILACDGCHTIYEKHKYLSSNVDSLNSLKTESDKLHTEISQNKIQLLDENKDILFEVKKAFLNLLQSKKCISNGMELSVFICEKTPSELTMFEYKHEPAIIYINNFYFCLFSKVILVFDCNGIFSTALDPTAFSIDVIRQNENVSVRNNASSQKKFVDSDSRLIKQGDTRTTWTHTRNDGWPDRRYSYNPRIEYRTDIFEYGTIEFHIADMTVSYIVSSQAAIDKFEWVKAEYIRKYNNLHNPIPDLLLLLKMVSNEDVPGVKSLINIYQSKAANNFYFCKVVTM